MTSRLMVFLPYNLALFKGLQAIKRVTYLIEKGYASSFVFHLFAQSHFWTWMEIRWLMAVCSSVFKYLRALLHGYPRLESLHQLYPSLHRTFQTFFWVPTHFYLKYYLLLHLLYYLKVILMDLPVALSHFIDVIISLLQLDHFCRHFLLAAALYASSEALWKTETSLDLLRPVLMASSLPNYH